MSIESFRKNNDNVSQIQKICEPDFQSVESPLIAPTKTPPTEKPSLEKDSIEVSTNNFFQQKSEFDFEDLWRSKFKEVQSLLLQYKSSPNENVQEIFDQLTTVVSRQQVCYGR